MKTIANLLLLIALAYYMQQGMDDPKPNGAGTYGSHNAGETTKKSP